MSKSLRVVGLAGSGVVVAVTVAIAGSGIGGVFNLGQSNSVNATTTLTGAAATQLSVRTTAGGNSIAVMGLAPFEGVRAAATRATGANYGIFASSASPAGYAGYFSNTAPTSAGYGVAVMGLASGGSTTLIHPGGHLSRAAGEFSGANGIIAAASREGGYGVLGLASSGSGIGGYFQNNSTNTESAVAVAGYASGGNSGLVHPGGGGWKAAGEFSGVNGIIGAASSRYGKGVIGLAGAGYYGVYGYNGGKAGAYSIYGDGDARIFGNLEVTGTLTKGAGSFKIDDPLDPANKYLSHSFVESPDMMNIYNGNVTTNANGEAVINLPDYFDALNRDPRYQLTVIGSPANAYVSEEVVGNTFSIKTTAPSVKVSWQITGVREDPYALQHPIIVEEDKAVTDRGHYLYPEGYGQPASLAIGANPQVAANVLPPKTEEKSLARLE